MVMITPPVTISRPMISWSQYLCSWNTSFVQFKTLVFFCVDLLYLLLQIQINSFSNQSFPVEIADDCFFFSDSGGLQ